MQKEDRDTAVDLFACTKILPRFCSCLISLVLFCRVLGSVRGEPMGARQVAEPVQSPGQCELSAAGAVPLRQLPVQGDCHQQRGTESAQQALSALPDQWSW